MGWTGRTPAQPANPNHPPAGEPPIACDALYDTTGTNEWADNAVSKLRSVNSKTLGEW